MKLPDTFIVIKKSPAFWAGILLRFALLPFFGSHYLRELFIPFVDQAVLDPFSNPWSHFSPNYFPYGSALFLIEFVPKFLLHGFFGQFALGPTWLGIAGMKLPLLALDVLTLFTLVRLAPRRRAELLLYYWFNPVLIYITYVHGQLDLAVMAFCILSLWLLTRKQFVWSAATFAVATLCKFTVVILVPFWLIYIWKRNFLEVAFRKIISWCVVWLSLSTLGFLPLVFAKALAYAAGASPQAERLFALTLPFGEGQALYLGVALVFATLGRLCASTKISEEGLIFGTGILLGMLVLVTNAMPGWYFWVLPFLSLFYANYVTAPRSLFWALCGFYLLNFGLSHFEMRLPEHAAGIAFTALQTTLAGLLGIVWALVIRRQAPLDGLARPQIIGIAGDSGAGKDTLCRLLCDLYDSDRVVMVAGDDYHRWERGDESWKNFTHLDPAANQLGQLATDAADLLSGKLVFQPHYDHQTGEFTAPRELRPNRTILIQGLHTLYLRGMRDALDLRVFVAPDERLRLAWKVQRDVKERGHELAEVLESYHRRKTDSERHIQPQRELADWVIEYLPKGELTEMAVREGAPGEFKVRHTLWNDAPVNILLDNLGKAGQVDVKVTSSGASSSRIHLDVSGGPDARAIREVALASFDSLREITRSLAPPRFHGGISGVSQLIALSLLSQVSKSRSI